MKKCKENNPRLGQVGGQAVIEGVMMRHKTDWALAVRMPDGGVSIKKGKSTSLRQKYKICNIPIVRGVIGFVESMILSFNTLAASTEALGIDDMEETKFDKWLAKHFGRKILDVVVAVSSVLGVALALLLFVFLPSFLTKLLDNALGGCLGGWKTLIEGAVKIVLFIAYLMLTSLMGDIRRTYEYHGAEHKTVFAYEAGVELTPENCRKFSRFHPRCGTSFIFVMLIIGILVASLLPWTNTGLRTVLKILVMPVIIGLGFEFIMLAGKHCDNIIVKILSAPGLFMQRITTREPDDSQLEIAIIALKTSMPEEFPDFTPTAAKSEDKAGDAAGEATSEEVASEESASEEAAEESAVEPTAPTPLSEPTPQVTDAQRAAEAAVGASQLKPKAKRIPSMSSGDSVTEEEK